MRDIIDPNELNDDFIYRQHASLTLNERQSKSSPPVKESYFSESFLCYSA